MVARTDARGAEAAQIVAADEVAVLDAHLLAEPVHAAELAAEAQRPFRGKGDVVGRGKLAANVPDIATQPRKVGAKRDGIAFVLIDGAVAPVVELCLPDRRGEALAGLLLEEQRGIRLNVGDA